MKNMKRLRFWVRVKKKRHAILFTAVTVVLFTLFQNCGAKQSTSSSGSGSTTGGSGGALVSVTPTSYAFTAATGSAPAVFTITNVSSEMLTSFSTTAAFGSSAFVIPGGYDTCNGQSLVASSSCSITVIYSNTSSSALSGMVTVAYSDQNGVSQPSLFLMVSGPAGSGGGTTTGGTTGINLQMGQNDIAIVNAGQWNLGGPTPFPAWKIYRGYTNAGGFHYLNTNVAIPTDGTTTSDGQKALMYPYQYEPSMIPIYRCSLSGNRHLTTTHMNCEGQSGAVMEYVLGFGHATQHGAEVPLYRLVKMVAVAGVVQIQDHLDSLNSTEGVSMGYALDSNPITAYVLPVGGSLTPSAAIVTATTPLYRVIDSSNHHMSTTISGEASPSYIPNGNLGNIYTSMPADGNAARPLFRCNAGYSKHITVNTPSCEVAGYSGDMLMGWVHDTQNAGEIPLYRFYNPSTGDYMDSNYYGDGIAYGYNGTSKILGYMKP